MPPYYRYRNFVPTRITLPGLLAVICVSALLLVTFVGRSTPPEDTRSDALVRSAVLPLTPSGTVIENTELFFMLPTTNAKGVLIYLHGCNHGGQDAFFLPEDRVVVHTALERGLAVLSITSMNRRSGCWSNLDDDILEKGQIVEKWMASVGLPDTLPRIGMGASSGGTFLFEAFHILKFKAMASYISPQGFHKEFHEPIPAVFCHMPRDANIALKVNAHEKQVVEAGVDAMVLTLEPHPFTVEVCNLRIPELGQERCQELIQKGRDKGLLDPNDSTVITPCKYHNDQWGDVMKEMNLDVRPQGERKPGTVSPTSFAGDSWLRAAIEEEIAVAYAVHEMSAEHCNVVLDFLTKHAGIS